MTLAAPPALVESGLLKHMLPRFSLKTGVRVTIAEDGDLALTDTPPGSPVFSRGAVVYFMDTPSTPAAERFVTWLQSDVGQRTLESFAPEDGAPFSAYTAPEGPVETAAFTGDVAQGEELSMLHCGRCHVIGERNRMNGLGSTPSFQVLKTLPDWSNRFEAFFSLNPHPSFTQVAGVTEPFDITRPPPISPIEMTLDDLEAILAFVSEVPAADLGAPLKAQ